MVKFEATFDAQIFDKERFNKQVKENIQNNMKIAASKFLEEAILRVPTFGGPTHSDLSTGFAIGAFAGLQQEVGDLIKIKMPKGGNISNLLNAFLNEQQKSALEKEKQRQKERADKKAQAKRRIEELRKEGFRFTKTKASRSIDSSRKDSRIRRTLISRGIRNLSTLRNFPSKGERTKEGLFRSSRVSPWYYPSKGVKIPKNIGTGAKFGTPAKDIFDFTNPRQAKFTFWVDITYFTLRDVGLGRGGSRGAWFVFQQGLKVFDAYMNDEGNIDKIFPDIGLFFLTKRYKADTSGRVVASYLHDVNARTSIPGSPTRPRIIP